MSARDTDNLPGEVKKQIGDAFPRNLEPTELLRTLKTVIDLYYSEAERLDQKLGMDRASRLKVTVRENLSVFS